MASAPTLQVRRQLSMYLPPDAAVQIERVRRLVDPVQSRLIPAHVTLCREDELDDLEAIRGRLLCAPFASITLRFGQPEASGGHGLLLKCIGGEERFRELREYLLASSPLRVQTPHITLAHPRNPRASENSPGSVSALREGVEVTLPTIELIEQEGGEPWGVLERYPLRGTPP